MAPVLLRVGSAAARAPSSPRSRGAREATRPTLLVVDDADASDADARRARASWRASSPARRCSVLATAERTTRCARPAPTSRSRSSRSTPTPCAAIAALLRAGPRPSRTCPSTSCSTTSGGVPGRVHELASAWARREAARRVGASARTRGCRPRRAASRRGGAGRGVVDLQAARERADLLAGDATRRVVCPFKGLASLRRCRRAVLLRARAARRRARRAGSSARRCSGSSDRRAAASPRVVRAGLLPALAGGVLPGSERVAAGRPPPWRASDARAAQLGSRAAPRRPRSCWPSTSSRRSSPRAATRRERAAFIDALVRRPRDARRARRARDPGRLLRPLRRLSGAGAAARRQPRARRTDAARRAAPRDRAARRSAPVCIVEPELVDALVADVEDEPGALPLLSTALLELWQRRDGRRLLLADVRAHRRRARSGRAAGGGRVRPARPCAAGRRAEGAAAARRRGQRRRGRSPARRRWRSSKARAATMSPRARAPHRPPPADDERDDGRGRPRSAAARVAAAARLARGGRRRPPVHRHLARRRARVGRPRTRPRRRSTAARGWPPRSSGATATSTSSTRPSAPSSTRAGPPPGARSGACASRSRASRRCSCIAALGGVVALHQRGTARSEARAAEAQRLGAQALIEPRLGPLAAARAPGCRAGRFARHPQQPPRRPAAQPGGRRRHWRRPGVR